MAENLSAPEISTRPNNAEIGISGCWTTRNRTRGDQSYLWSAEGLGETRHHHETGGLS